MGIGIDGCSEEAKDTLSNVARLKASSSLRLWARASAACTSSEPATDVRCRAAEISDNSLECARRSSAAEASIF